MKTNVIGFYDEEVNVEAMLEQARVLALRKLIEREDELYFAKRQEVEVDEAAAAKVLPSGKWVPKRQFFLFRVFNFLLA